MKSWKSQKQQEALLNEKNKELEKQNKVLTEALERIANTYDNIEDLAGVIARETLDKFR